MPFATIIKAIWQFICRIFTFLNRLIASRVSSYQPDTSTVLEEGLHSVPKTDPATAIARSLSSECDPGAIAGISIASDEQIQPSEDRRRVILKDIVLDRPTGDDLDDIALIIVEDNKNRIIWPMEEVSSTRWKSTRIFELNPNEDIVFIARTKRAGVGGVGCIVLTNEELKPFMEVENQMNFERSFLTEKKVQPLNMTFVIDSRTICSTTGGFEVDPGSDSSTPPQPTSVSKLLNRSGNLFMQQFRKTQNTDDLTKAITAYEQAVRQTIPDDKNYELYVTWLNNLGSSLQRRFDNLGEISDIERAISNHEKALQLTPDGHSNMAAQLDRLADCLHGRFEFIGNISDVERALSNQQRAVQLTPDGDQAMSSRLKNFASFLVSRFEYGGADLSVIDRAISNLKKALELTPDVPSTYDLLGICLQNRFLHTGDLSEIEAAISWKLRGLQLLPDDHPNRAFMFNSLGVSIWKKFERTEDSSDLASAISYQEQAVQLLPEGHTETQTFLSNLGVSLDSLHQQTGDLADIKRSISIHQKAVHLTPEGHSGLPFLLTNLGNALCSLFLKTEDLSDLESAISALQRAVQNCPEDNFYMAYHLQSLALAFSSRFEHTGDISDIETAIHHQRRAVEHTPENIPGKAFRLQHLALYLQNRFDSTKNTEDLEQAISTYRLSATHVAGRPSVRFQAARDWAELSRESNDPSQSLEAFTAAIELMSQVAGVDSMLHRRHTNLVDISDLTALAVASAFADGLTETALAWLEQGRCLVWNQIKQLRTPVDKLLPLNPTLAERFLRVARDLEEAGSRPAQPSIDSESTSPDPLAVQSTVQTHVELAKEWKELLSEIRGIPGFQDFLQPPKVADILSRLPSDGHIIIFNIHDDRCDALALKSGVNAPIHIPLKSFSHQQALHMHDNLREYLKKCGVLTRELDRAGRSYHPPGNEVVLQIVLRDLWSHVVKPILDAIGYSSPRQTRSRIWWCPTGPLALLPIHAAGIYGKHKAPGSCVSDFVISSYTPTVNTLLDKIEEARTMEHFPTGLLLISQPNTPGQIQIPATSRETHAVEAIVSATGIKSLLLEGEAATIVQVQEEMRAHGWIHFACHAIQNPQEPLKSGVHLHDGRLELLEMMRRQIPNTDHAFLSACQTSTGTKELSDEAVHLAAGMLAAGYRGVVATMWSIKDMYAPQIAEDFYSHLLEGTVSGKQGLNAANSACALDYSIQRIQEKVGSETEHALLTWVPYVHFGI